MSTQDQQADHREPWKSTLLATILAHEDLIRNRAFELYVERGRVDGFDVDDWLKAEAELAVAICSAASSSE